jgi:predicted RNA polymerase sigma factor
VTVDDVELRELVPRVLSVLVRRGADFATAEDAVQEALIRALSAWGDESPADPTGWLVTVAWRAFLDMARSDAARRDRELRFRHRTAGRRDPERRRHAARRCSPMSSPGTRTTHRLR